MSTDQKQVDVMSEFSDDDSTSPMIDLDETLEPYIRKHRDGRTSSNRRRKNLPEEEIQTLRLNINSRERRRMHDLNSALDSLRQVMPYANSPNVRKHSKIATLHLARNHIMQLTQALDEMKRMVSDGFPQSRLPHPALAFPQIHHNPLLTPIPSTQGIFPQKSPNNDFIKFGPVPPLLVNAFSTGSLHCFKTVYGPNFPCRCQKCLAQINLASTPLITAKTDNQK